VVKSSHVTGGSQAQRLSSEAEVQARGTATEAGWCNHRGWVVHGHMHSGC